MKSNPLFFLSCLAAALDGGQCGVGGGGVLSFYIAACDDVDTFTINSTSYLVTAFVMETGKTFYEVRPRKQTGGEVSTFVPTAGGGQAWNHAANFTIPNQNATNAKAIYDLASCCCVYVIAKMANGEHKLLGLNWSKTTGDYYSAQMSVGDGTTAQSGTATADLNGYNMALSAEGVNNGGLIFASGVIAAAITAGDIVTI